MPNVELGRSGAAQPRLPAVCVKSGIPTSDFVRLSGSAAPGWTGAMILFGFLPWLFASSMAGRRYELVLPWCRERVARYRSWRRAGWLLMASGPLLAIAASASGSSSPALLLTISVVGVAVVLGNELRNGIGVRLSRDSRLVVTRVHPNFADECRRQLGTPSIP